MALEKFTTVMGIEMDEHDMYILDKLPDGIYVKALVVEDGCGPKAKLVKINAELIDHCGEVIEENN